VTAGARAVQAGELGEQLRLLPDAQAVPVVAHPAAHGPIGLAFRAQGDHWRLAAVLDRVAHVIGEGFFQPGAIADHRWPLIGQHDLGLGLANLDVQPFQRLGNDRSQIDRPDINFLDTLQLGQQQQRFHNIVHFQAGLGDHGGELDDLRRGHGLVFVAQRQAAGYEHRQGTFQVMGDRAGEGVKLVNQPLALGFGALAGGDVM